MSFTDKYSVMILVPMIPPPANSYARMHWAVRKAELDKWKRTIWAMVQSRDKRFLENNCTSGRKMRVEITFQHKREYDQDNMHAVCKLPLDALVRLRLLFDDKPSDCELHVNQELLNAKQTKIYITEAQS